MSVCCGSEEGFGDYPEGEVRHLLDNVERLALPPRRIRPSREGSCGLGDHQGGKADYAPPVECGLLQAPLVAPEVAVAHDQALTHYQLQKLVLLGFEVVAVIRAQDMADLGRIVEEDEGDAVPEPEPYYGTVIPRRRRQYPELLSGSSPVEEDPV